MNEKHEMILAKTHSSGAEEWNCPTCGRRMLIHWEPKFKRTVLEAGSPDVAHSGFKSNPQISDGMGSSINENALSEETETPIDEARLAPWAAWLEDSNFENLWDSDNQ
jgi:hypothetical protein